MKKSKGYLTDKWLVIKEMFETNTNGSKEYGTNFEIDGELNQLIDEFIVDIGEITLDRGFDAVVEKVRMDVWKERAWITLENAGLLEPYTRSKMEDLLELEREQKEINEYNYF